MITRTNTPLERCLKQYQYHVHAITQKYFDLVGAGRGWTAFQTCLWKQLDLPKITPKSNCSSNNVPPKSHALVKKIHPVLRQSQLSFNYHFVSPWYSHCVSCPHTIYPSVAIIAESSDTWHLSRAQVFFFRLTSFCWSTEIITHSISLQKKMSGQNFESEDMYLLIISGPIFTVKKMMISYDPQGWKESIPSGCDLTQKKTPPSPRKKILKT